MNNAKRPWVQLWLAGLPERPPADAGPLVLAIWSRTVLPPRMAWSRKDALRVTRRAIAILRRRIAAGSR